MRRSKRNPDDLSRIEILSAWLGFWKPRDVEVPPVPKRKLAIGGALLVLVLAAVALVAVPAIDSSKDEAAEREARESAEARAAERRRLEAEQAAHRGAGRPAPDRRSRLALLERVQASIGADARRRIAAGELDGRVLRVRCRPGARSRVNGRGPEEDLGRSRGSYDCTAVTRDIPAGARNVPGALGHPFVAVVDFATGRYTWCKTNPAPGERVVPDPRDVVALPKECVL
jgi:Ni/Co efflux regulator RcnB